MALTFTTEAADRLRSLAVSQNSYERAVLAAIKPVLNHLDRHPELHRIGASQFHTTPPTWARVLDIDDGADWLIAWTTGAGDTIRILRIEPAPSLA